MTSFEQQFQAPSHALLDQRDASVTNSVSKSGASNAITHPLVHQTRAAAIEKPDQLTLSSTVSAQPKFAGLSNKIADAGTKVFTQVSEKYIWNFIALDVVALWIMRIIKGLDRGREPYDATKDPSNDGLPPLQVLKKSIRKNVEGLNYLNAGEEAAREMLTGPMGFIAPAVVIGFATKYFARNALMMSHQELTQLSDTLQHHAGSSESVEAAVRKTLTSLFDGETGFKQRKLSIDNGKGITKVQVSSEINQWADQWIDAAKQVWDKGAKATKKDLDAFQEAVKPINERLSTLIQTGYNQQHKLDDRLYKSDRINVKIIKDGVPEIVEKSTGELFESLGRFNGLIHEVTEKFAVSSKTPEALSHLVESTYKRTVGGKFLFGVAATLIGAFAMSFIPRIVQRNEHYPANRGLQNHAPATGADNAEQAVTPTQQPLTTPSLVPTRQASPASSFYPAPNTHNASQGGAA